MAVREVASDRSPGEWLHLSPVIYSTFPRRRHLPFLSWEMERLLLGHPQLTGLGDHPASVMEMKALKSIVYSIVDYHILLISIWGPSCHPQSKS